MLAKAVEAMEEVSYYWIHQIQPCFVDDVDGHGLRGSVGGAARL